jgi:hypothetical protein
VTIRAGEPMIEFNKKGERRPMKRAILAILLPLAALMAAGTGVPTFAAAGGNSSAAHACQQGGYAGIIGTNGTLDTRFGNTRQCVSYAAEGGLLVPLSRARPCLDGGFANLAPASDYVLDGSTLVPFTREASCVQYVGLGGNPITVTQDLPGYGINMILVQTDGGTLQE